MRRIGILLVLPAALIAAGVWTYQLYFGQLNDMIAVQRCALAVEEERRVTLHLPPAVQCRDYWGEPVAYFVRDGTYVLVSAGSDRQMDADYGSLAPSDIRE